MPNPLLALVTLQLAIAERCLAVTHDMLGLCLALQPVAAKTTRPLAGRDLIVVERLTGRHFR
jgi:hypothetical protein